MIGFLREKNAQENEFCQQKHDLKRQEMQNFQTLMANQQQQTNLLMQQQHDCCFFEYYGQVFATTEPSKLNQAVFLHCDYR